MTTPFMALHVTAHRKGLSAASMCTPERLLAGVRVGVDAERRRARESLVACAADIAIMVLLVGSCSGRREVVVVLPSRSHGGDERWRARSRLCVLVVNLLLRHLRRGDGRRGLEA